MPRTIHLLALITIWGLIGTACGDADDGIFIDEPWARATATAQNTAAVYFTVSATEADTLTGVFVSSEVAASAALHETSMDDAGAMMMSMVQSVDVPGGGEVVFAPGGFHVMLADIVAPLRDGATFEMTLVFAQAGNVTVEVEVRDQ